MPRPLLLLPLSALACALGCSAAYAQPYPPGYQPPPPPPYAGAPGPYAGPQGPYAGGPGPYARGPAVSGENCGTPDDPKPCPQLPRHPLPYYPGNRP